MLPNFPKLAQKGYISLVLIVFALLIAALIFPFKFPVQNYTQSDGFYYCREFITDPGAPVIEVPGTKQEGPAILHKLIKKNVPIRLSLNKGGLGGEHFAVGGNIEVEGKNFEIYYPDRSTSYSFKTEGKDGAAIRYLDYGLVFLHHLTDEGVPETVESGGESLHVFDIYQDVTKPPLPLAEEVLKCVDEGVESMADPLVLVPEQDTSEDKKQVQLEWFVIKQTKFLPKAWWTPHCKPAIYLYPKEKQLVNVKVFPEGYLTYVDPPYDNEKGWTVTAFPDGKLEVQNSKLKVKSYDYLYYESKIKDEAIRKPDKGWVVKSKESKVTEGSKESDEWFKPLEEHFKTILPKLGLNEKQTQDFIEYWKKALPFSPYYFVGIIDKENVNEIERLEITPKPDFINRVRVYFERLDSPKEVETPTLPPSPPPTASLAEGGFPLFPDSFAVTEWGGMVKNDPNHPFTCSQ